MKDFIDTIKDFPDILRHAFKLFRDSYKQSKVIFSGYLILSLILTFVPYFRNFIQGLLINNLQGSLTITSEFKLLFALFIGIITIPSFLEILRNFFDKTNYFKVSQFYENELVRKSIEIDPQLHENKDFNNLKNRISGKGIYTIPNFQEYFIMFSLDLLTLILTAVTLYHFTKLGFLILIVTTIPVLIIKIVYGQSSWYIWGNDTDTEKRSKYWEYKTYFENFSSYIELKITEAKEYFKKYRSDFLKEVFEKKFKNEKQFTSKSFWTTIISQAGIVYIIYSLFVKVLSNELPVGSFIFAISLVTTFTVTFVSLFSNLGKMYPDYRYVKDFFDFMKVESIVKNTGTQTLNEVPPTIEFKNIFFKYPGADTYVLKNFNLTIEKGDKIAVIGLNGAGKTTFVKLLCRFYDPTEGEILLNGINIKEYDLEEWYKNLGVLFQEYGKYHIPLEDLVSLGRHAKTIDHKKVKNSLQKAEADFVNTLPYKEKTQLGKQYTDGVDISVGQWQKLAIGRMFYRDPAVMILDEPTSSIDAEAEAKIFETLEKLSKDKTVIMISHRFSTVRNANKICVIKDAKLHEYGTHEELMVNNDEYARLFTLQAEGYK